MSRVHYRGGRIFTATEQEWASSLVVDDDTLLHVGSTEDAERIEGLTRTVDLEGALVLPGIVDAHAHIVGLGEALGQIDLADAADLAEIQDRLRRTAAADPDAPRLCGFGWLFAALDGQLPTRQMLDQAVPDRPVYLAASDQHSAWVNTAALAELGIGPETPDPLSGEIARDADGVATGMLYERAALGLMRDVLDGLTTDADRLAALQSAFEHYLAAGVTAAVDMGLGDPELTALESALEAGEGRLPLRVAGHWIINRHGDHAEELAQVDRAIALSQRHQGPWLRVAGIKIFVDGVIDSCTAAMVHPFADGRHPDAIWDADSLNAVVARADRAGLQVAMHAIGDRASALALGALEHACEVNGDHPRRHRIEHLETVTPDVIGRMGKLGVIASVQPVHADPAIQENWREMLGDTRVARGFPWTELEEAGVRLVIGSDAPTAPYAPLPNLYVATTRRSASRSDLPANHAGYAMTLETALLRATREAAWAAGWEGVTGRLESGLSADFIVLDRDPFQEGVESLLEARVTTTVVAGREVGGLTHGREPVLAV
ncbi:amidohydrolase [Nocardioides sp. Kera G14]|uniref:amidohydrolase n=1 Tax=Nocardioides sp. Kera G14 TaxID=2884264 RepID=UPI001D1048EE|nr:amidohydrolase [Nocardioides sp. Kera G14]UDY22955.1 amidohydrolase [Nocardioides sp. Kera G14]